MDQIDEVRLKMSQGGNVLAYASVVVGGFVIHDIKLIGVGEKKFISMPSRKLQRFCGRCRRKNILKAIFCNWCGDVLPAFQFEVDETGRPILFADIIHPITKERHEQMEAAVVAAYDKEVK